MIFRTPKVRSFSFSTIKPFFVFFQLCTALTVVGSMAVFANRGFSGAFGWLFELSSNFPIHYLLLQIIAMTMAFFFKYKKLAFIWCCFILLNLTQIAPFYFPTNKNVSAKNQVLSFLQMNVLQESNSYSQAVSVIEKYKPDVICMEEYSHAWNNALKEKLSDYPYRFLLPADDWFGLALYSKFPIADAQQVYFIQNGPRALVAKIAVGKDILNTVCLHTMPPVDAAGITLRNDELAAIARYAKTISPLVLLGDLNCSPWSYCFKELLKEGNLFNSQMGFGVQASWPTEVYPFFFLKVPIDHFVASKTITVLDRRIGPCFGSDHYPVFVKIAMPQ